MVANFQSMPGAGDTQEDLDKHASRLGRYIGLELVTNGAIGNQPPPPGYEDYTAVDVIGKKFVWLNETFIKEKYTWYIWYESVFLVPNEMAAFLLLKWPQTDIQTDKIYGSSIGTWKHIVEI